MRGRLRETFAPGTHAFTDVIDADGHGNGPFHLRLAMTRTADDRFILDTTQTDDQAPGPVNYLMNPHMPGMALGLFFLGGDRLAGLAMPAARTPSMRCCCARVRCSPPVSSAARPARGDDDADAGRPQRVGERGRRQRPGVAFRLCHHPPARHGGRACVPDVGRRRRGLRRAGAG
ncbi:MAG: hypothetical protein WDN49_06785 [Acetobacteraceae bacterium]